MSSGAFALYVDITAGSGGGGVAGNRAAIDRIVPLPRHSHGDDDDFEFDKRRLTLYYDNAFVPGSAASVTITGRFLGVAAAINENVPAGECKVVEVPHDACAATLHLNQLGPADPLRGPISTLVEYSN